ncbi:MAG: hypothetical protein PVG73_01575 [Desulfobacterales bacterium]|jgi:hypothetical protein
MKKLLTLLISMLLITSCASVAERRSLEVLSDNDFSVDIPQGWWKPKHLDKYLITKDGVFLQYVLIQQRPIDRPYKNTKKKLKMGMLPQEAAGVIIDEIASDRRIYHFNVIENAPAIIDGREGFKILFTYQDKKGSIFKTLYYGFIHGESFFNLRYNAAMRYYFEKDIAAFEHILSSFKIVKDKEAINFARDL